MKKINKKQLQVSTKNEKIKMVVYFVIRFYLFFVKMNVKKKRNEQESWILNNINIIKVSLLFIITIQYEMKWNRDFFE